MKRIYNLQTVLPHILIGLLLIFVAYMGSAQTPESIGTSSNDIGKSYTAGTRIITGLPKYFPDTVKNETLFAMDKNNNRLFTWNPKSSRWEVDKIRGNSSSTPRMETVNSLVFDYTNTSLQDSNNLKYYRWDLTNNIWNTGLNGSDTIPHTVVTKNFADNNYKYQVLPTVNSMMSYAGNATSISVTDSLRGGIFNLTTLTGNAVDSGIVFPSAISGYVWKRQVNSNYVKIDWWATNRNGTTADNIYINKGVDYLTGVNGGILEFGGYVYAITSYIKLASNIHYKGIKGKTELKLINEQTCIMGKPTQAGLPQIVATNLKVTGFIFNGNRANLPFPCDDANGNLIACENISNSEISSNEFKEAIFNSVLLYSAGCLRMLIRDNFIHDGGKVGTITGGCAQSYGGVSCHGGTSYNLIQSNWIQNIKTYGIWIQAGGGGGRSNTFDNNDVIGNGVEDIRCYVDTLQNPDQILDVVISNNRITGTGTNEIAMRLGANSATKSTFTFFNNTIKNFPTYAIFLGGNATVTGSGNKFIDCPNISLSSNIIDSCYIFNSQYINSAQPVNTNNNLNTVFSDLQTVQNSTTATFITALSGVLKINPTTAISGISVILPSNPSNNQKLIIEFGGTIAYGSPVITTTLNWGGGTVYAATISYPITAGSKIELTYNASISKWVSFLTNNSIIVVPYLNNITTYGNPTTENYRIKLDDLGGTANDVGIGIEGSYGSDITWFNSLNGFYFKNGVNGEALRIVQNGSIGINNSNPSYKLDIDAKTASTGNPIRLQGLNIGAITDSIVSDSAGILRRLTAAQVVQNGITKTSVTSTFTVPASGEYLIPFTLTGTTNTSIVAASYIATDVTGCSFSIPYLAGDGTGTVKVINRTASAVTFTSLKVNFAVLSY